jgi:hypothetical protein
VILPHFLVENTMQQINQIFSPLLEIGKKIDAGKNSLFYKNKL